MTSPASIAKHPIHPILITLPVGLWVFSLVSDIIYRAGWGPAVWNSVAFYTIAGGIIGALLAAVPGLIDLVSLSEPKLKKIGIWHMCINLIAVAVFAVDFWLRTISVRGAVLPFVLSICGVALIFISGWLGGELVHVHGVSVEPQRNILEEERERMPRHAA